MATQEERRDRARTVLLEAALDVFGEEGYSRANVGAIAERAGVSRTLVYHHFGSKEELLLALYEDLHAEVIERVQGAVSPDRGPIENLVAGANAHFDACGELKIARVLLLEAPSLPSLTSRVDARLRDWHQFLERELRQLPDGKNASTTARILLGALHAATMAIVSHDDPTSESKRASNAFGRLVRGLA